MSFSSIRSIAYSSLATTQVQMALTSANIANADTEGYSRKVAIQTSTNSGTLGSGVTITGIASNVDKYLLKDLVAAASTLGAATVTDSYADRLQNLLGTTSGSDGSGTSLANTVASLETALTQLSGTSESETLQALTVSALDDLAGQLRETSAAIQSLRADADDAIETAVGTVNEALHAIDDLNGRITDAQARGESTADLEDQRNTALQTLSGQMGVAYYVNSDNQMRIYTASGTTLLDSRVHELSYSAASAVASATVFDAITVDDKDVTGQIATGAIGALLAQRDTELPAVQATLDELANGLIETLNSVHNGGTSLPPPSSLTGTTATSASEAFSGTGTARFAVLDSGGALVGYQDLDLSAYATVGELAGAIDAIDGLSASINAAGRLVISADATGNGVAIADIDASIGTAGQGLSDYFGLNDLVIGRGAATIAVRADILSTPGRLAVSTLSTDTAPTPGSTVVSAGDSGIADALNEALGGDHAFAAAGRLKASTGSFADYAGKIITLVATAATSAATALDGAEAARSSLADSLASQSGVNLDEETARLSELEQQYSMAAQILEVLNTMFNTLLDVAKSA